MPLLPECDCYILTGERSGDAYGAQLVELLKDRLGDISIAAIGGEQLVASGAEVDVRMDDYSVMGILPVLLRFREFLALGKRVESCVRARRPKVIVGIDYPGFNLRIMRRLADMRPHGTRFVQMVAPQVWAWRPRRAKKIARTLDHLLCFFPFEPRLFTRFGCQATCIGHPLVDMVAADKNKDSFVPQKKIMIAPGGRKKEVQALLPIFAIAARLFQREMKNQGQEIDVVVSTVPEIDRKIYRQACDLPLYEGDYRDLCRESRVGLIASGTACLEAALCGLPHVIGYKVDSITGVMAKYLLKTKFVGLPNIVHGEEVSPELLQDQLTPARVVNELHRLWNGASRDDIVDKLSKTPEKLGGKGSLERVCDNLCEEIRRGLRVPEKLLY